VEILVPKTHLGKSRLSFAGWRTREARRKERGCLSHVGHKRMGIGGHSFTKHSQQNQQGTNSLVQYIIILAMKSCRDWKVEGKQTMI